MRRKRWVTGIISGVLMGSLVLATAGLAAPTAKRRARVAARYIVTQQLEDGSIPSFSAIGSTADAILALAAARRAPGAISEAVSYLESHSDDVDKVGEKAKVVLALIATGRDSTDFDGRDLVAELAENLTAGGRYGDDPSSYVFDQALAILGLTGAGEDVPQEAIEWLLQAQCRDGGWQFDSPSAKDDNNHCSDGSSGDFTVSDTNTTSYALQALAAVGEPLILPRSPWRFFKDARDPFKKGWVFAPQFACGPGEAPPGCSLTDANSTALVIQAFVASERKVPRKGSKALRNLQYRRCGKNAGAFAVAWSVVNDRLRKSGPDIGATIGAVQGLLRKPLPLTEQNVTKPAPTPGQC
jgi:hypothetical protein